MIVETGDDGSGPSFGVVVLIAIALFVLVLLVAVSKGAPIFQITFTTHSMESHSYAVPAIENCFDYDGGEKSMIFSSGDRFTQFCDDGSHNNYWRVYECEGSERVVVTQFKQAKRKLVNYIRNKGMKSGADIPC